ncbi:transposase [Wolbachia endosymbiont of Armadillidium vulgare str. wVulC]|nr:transposase [Wolbachia endosymbiont of Armadillidium vulgare str. wVulC]
MVTLGVDDCSIETMCQLLNGDSIEITKQGLGLMKKQLSL